MASDTSADRVAATGGPAKGGTRLDRITRSFGHEKYLYAMTAVGVVLVFLFSYLPMYGVLLAFKRYDFTAGILGSPWVGFHNFELFFKNPFFWRLIRNTVLLGFLSIVWGFWPPILLALLLNEVRSPGYKRAVQTITYLPHFIAVVVIIGMLKELLAYDGVVNRLVAALGGEQVSYFAKPGWFRTIYIGSGVWQGIGFSTIIYLAALSGIDPELYESSIVEGAGRLQMARFITLPHLLPYVMVLLILSTVGIINVGFEKVFLMYSPATYETADVIQTFVYRLALEGGQFAFGTAVGLFNSVVSLIFMVAVNLLARRVAGHSLW